MRIPTLLLICSLLSLPVVQADQTDSRLDGLFRELLQADDAAMIRVLENRIWSIWYEHPNGDLERLMEIGTRHMNDRQFPEALLIFNQVIDSFPDYAEGWNKRATLYYMVGNLDASIADIEQTLTLEPRHFGALSGLGLVYLQQEQLTKARDAFRNLIGVHPNSPNAKQNLDFVEERLRMNVI